MKTTIKTFITRTFCVLASITLVFSVFVIIMEKTPAAPGENIQDSNLSSLYISNYTYVMLASMCVIAIASQTARTAIAKWYKKVPRRVQKIRVKLKLA